LIRAWRLIHAELTSRIRDKSFWLETILLPVVVTLIMGLALGQTGRGKTPELRVGLVAVDPENLLAEVLEIAYGAIGSIVTQRYLNYAEAKQHLDAFSLDAVVVVSLVDPQTSSELHASVEAGKRTLFQAGMVAQITEATLRALSADLTARRVVADLMVQRGQDPTDVWMAVPSVPVSARLDQVSLARFDLLGSQFAGMAIFFSVLSGFRVMMSIFGPHRNGLNMRLTGAPIPGWAKTSGNVGSVATISFLQTLVVLLIGALIFQIEWGPSLPLLTAAALSAIAAAALALSLVTLPIGGTARGLVGMLVVLGGSVLGGALVPLDGANPWLTGLAPITLHYWVTGLFTGLSRGLTTEEVANMYMGVILYGAVALSLSAIFLARGRTRRA